MQMRLPCLLRLRRRRSRRCGRVLRSRQNRRESRELARKEGWLPTCDTLSSGVLSEPGCTRIREDLPGFVHTSDRPALPGLSEPGCTPFFFAFDRAPSHAMRHGRTRKNNPTPSKWIAAWHHPPVPSRPSRRFGSFPRRRRVCSPSPPGRHDRSSNACRSRSRARWPRAEVFSRGRPGTSSVETRRRF
jgi:hypothetical protein